MDLQEAFDAGFDAVKSYVDRSFAALEGRLSAIETQQAEVRAADRNEVTRLVEESIERVQAHWLDRLPEVVSRYLEANPPKDGADGRDGRDGVSLEEVLRALVADGEGVASPLGSAVAEYFRMFPVPAGKDGRDGANGRDAIGVAGALINREGELVFTFSDGSHSSVGRVVGRDGTDGAPGERGEAGKDGLGFDDLDVSLDERTLCLRFARGEETKAFSLTLPIIIDRGVWTEGHYQRGDAVSWGGSMFIAQCDTKAKPDTNDDWRLAVRRGRDGKRGEDGKPGPAGKDGLPGRDGRVY